MVRSDKAAAVAELADAFRSADAAVLTEYRGLSVAQLAELRRSLGEQVKYQVVKNTLTKIAARDAGVDAFDGLFEGPSAIAFVRGDPVEAAKSLRDFARANPPLVIKGGLLEGRALSPEELTRLADLESRDVLLGKLAGVLQASLAGAAALFQAPLTNAARLAEALRAKVEESGGAAAAAEPSAEAAAEPAADEPTADESTAEEPASAEA